MSDDDDTITGSYVNGCDVNLISLCGLDLSDDQNDALWGNINEHDLLEAAGANLELEMDEDGMPSMSDVYYIAHVDDGFTESLKEVILEIIEESECDPSDY
ncbi:hypothetical protein OAU26_08810 [Mariniblastus sp.]|nr:hypothetical protein [Mariniblastus sp.]